MVGGALPVVGGALSLEADIPGGPSTRKGCLRWADLMLPLCPHSGVQTYSKVLPRGRSCWPPVGLGKETPICPHKLKMRKLVYDSLAWEDPLEKGTHGYPLQYSGLENSMDRRASWATVHRVAKGQT